MRDVEERLWAEREAAIARLQELTEDLEAMIEASEGSNADDEHDPEGATIGFERAQLTATIGLARKRLAEVERALGRVEEGGYGRCATCGVPIPEARLAARPTAVTCIDCTV